MATTLAKAIRQSGLTKTECAEASGIARSQLYLYETGRLRPEFKNAVNIAAALGVETDDIIEFRDVTGKAEARRVEELIEDVREQVLGEGQEVHIAIGDLPDWLRQEFERYARQNPDRVRHLTLDLSLEEMQELANRPASKNGHGKKAS